MNLKHIPKTDKGTFRDGDANQHRYFLASLVHYFSLSALVHKAGSNTGSGSVTYDLLKETLDESIKEVHKFYFSGNLYNSHIDEDHIFTFDLEHVHNEQYKDLMISWQTNFIEHINDFDNYHELQSLQCGMRIPSELLNIVVEKEEFPLTDYIANDKSLNVYFDKVYLKLESNQRRRGSLIFS